MALARATRLGPYEIVSPIGTGGMGEVYRARDTRLDRTVAIKILPADIADDAEARARFEQEARVIAAFDHPHQTRRSPRTFPLRRSRQMERESCLYLQAPMG